MDLSGSMAAMLLADPLTVSSSPAGGDDAAVDLPRRRVEVEPAAVSSSSDLQERYAILRSIAEECIGDEELLNLLRVKPNSICYDGFEPSGRMHIAQGVVKAINIKKMVSAGCKVKILVADWFAMLNKKMGGDLDGIRTVGLYMVEVWKSLGVKTDEVEFVWSSEEIFKRPNEYWPLVMDIAVKRSINRIVRCCQIMGRSEKDDLSAAQFLYPLMQCADVFFLKVDICQLGMDQRKVNMLAREYGELSGKSKPIILSHHMLPGLNEGQEKMSKSDPSSAIFMEDDECQINSKIKKAFCPINVVEGNPCLEYIKYIVLPWFGSFDVARQEANGGNKIYRGMDEVISDYSSGALHPADLKPALTKAINKILRPVRDHFNSNNKAKVLLEAVKAAVCTRKELLHASCNWDATMDSPTTGVGVPDAVDLSGSIAAMQLADPPTMSSSPAGGDDAAVDLPQRRVEVEPAAVSSSERYAILRSIAEECIEDEELLNLLRVKPNPICYDGFEPSGRMHIAQGVVKAINIKKMISAGCKVKILVADWFAMLNKKMGGDLDAIRTVGLYMVEVWKSLGVKTDEVEFLWSSEEIFKRPNEYWPLVMDIAGKMPVNRILRCCQIMGRSEKDDLSAAQFLYPLMQCADVFFLKVDICQLGTDQREVNMLAREYAELSGKSKPIILSHHMLPGLKKGQEKMSKNDPSSAIFMEDDESQINSKIKNVFCPINVVEGNPCLEYIKYIVLPWFGSFDVARQEANGGNKIYKGMDEVIADYSSSALHPADLKPALTKAINKILQPVRDHFNSNNEAKVLLEAVKVLMTKYRKTN